MCAHDEHQEREADCGQAGQERVARIDPPESTVADHNSCNDLADDDRRAESMQRCEQRTEQARSDDEGERTEAHVAAAGAGNDALNSAP